MDLEEVLDRRQQRAQRRREQKERTVDALRQMSATQVQNLQWASDDHSEALLFTLTDFAQCFGFLRSSREELISVIQMWREDLSRDGFHFQCQEQEMARRRQEWALEDALRI